MAYFQSHNAATPSSLGCGTSCQCNRCRRETSALSSYGERYVEDDEDDEPPPPRPAPGPGRMPTGMAGFGSYNGLGQAPLTLPPPTALRLPQPAWRSRIPLAPPQTLQMPAYETVTGFGANRWQLTAAQRRGIHSFAERIATSWRTTYPVTSLRFSGFMLASETVPRLDMMRGAAVREALMEALNALAPNLRGRIRWEPDEPRGLSAREPRVEVYAWLGPTPPPPRTPLMRVPPPAELRPGAVPGMPRGPETLEQRLDRILRTLPPVHPQRGRSFNQWFWNEVDTRLNDVMRRTGIPRELQPYVRAGARAAIERGAEAVFGRILDAAELRGEPREALETTVRALLSTPIR